MLLESSALGFVLPLLVQERRALHFTLCGAQGQRDPLPLFLGGGNLFLERLRLGGVAAALLLEACALDSGRSALAGYLLLILLPFDHTAHDRQDQYGNRDGCADLGLLRGRLLLDGSELSLVLALCGEGLQMSSVLGLRLGPLELGLLDGFDTRGFFTLALFGDPARFLCVSGLALLRVSGGSLLGLAAFASFSGLPLLSGCLLSDSFLLEIHQLLQRKEN